MPKTPILSKFPRRLVLYPLALVFWALIPVIAHAENVTFTLDPPALTTTAGSALSFTGTIVNNDPTTLFLSSMTLNLFGDSTLYLFEDSDVFLNNVPLSLPGNGGTYTGPIFGLTVSSAAPDGSYFGLVTLQGGPNDSDGNDLGTQNFQVV